MPRATCTSTSGRGRPTASSRASRSTRWSPPRTPTRAASATPATSRCGRARSRASRSRRSGTRRGAQDARAGTSSARRCRAATSARSSTSTAAGSTCASRITRTNWRSPPPPATRFARYWVHNGLVTVGDQKMSKSLGNFLLAEDVLRERDPLVVRYALAAAHYRSSLDITPSSFDEAESALDRIRTLPRAGRPARGEFGWFSLRQRRLRRSDGRRPRRAAGARRRPRARARGQHGAGCR